MSSIEQIQQDLQFVRQAVGDQTRTDHPPTAIYGVWATYVMVGYALIDFYPAASGWFFLIGGVAATLLSWLLGKRYAYALGEVDRPKARRRVGHFIGGIALAIIGSAALAAVIPALRGSAGGQVIVVMIGLVYFLGGVHFDRNLLWLGPVLMAGGVLVGLVSRYGWTALGAVIAAGLVLPPLLSHRPRAAKALTP